MATSKKPAGGKKSTGKKKAAKPKAAKSKVARGSVAAAAPVSFAAQIAPLFRAQDVQCMRGRNVFLINYEWMSAKNTTGQYANANMVLGKLKPGAGQGRMPLGGPYWSDANLQLFSDWIAGGCQP
ncbi:MAG: hypothetical protein QOH25_751 [Acidobacteriota bacterium]|jgi:hypothetical protein|nr:hypothetical protein [Acidobacteriota bacterium]